MRSDLVPHEQRIREFMASIPGRLRARVEAKHAVLSDDDERAIQQHEHLWPPELLDSVLASSGPVHRAPLKSQPSYQQRVPE